MPMRQLVRLLCLSCLFVPAIGCSGTEKENAISQPAPTDDANQAEADSLIDSDENANKRAGAKGWYENAQRQLQTTQRAFATIKPERGAAKNVVLFIGDGMGVATVTAARILDGQRRGASGEEGLLSFERFPFTGLSKTYNVDAQTPDSAGTMTAIITGVKTNAGVISVSEATRLGDCESSQKQELGSALELAELAGMATGIVTTTRITHATPAATYAKAADRSWEDDARMPPSVKAAGCRDIARQLIEFETATEARYGADIDGIDVVMGGGWSSFLPQTGRSMATATGGRLDGRNLIEEWKRLYPDGFFVRDGEELTAAVPKANRLFGLFSPNHLLYEADRKATGSKEPSLSAMTAAALDILQRSPGGYLLVVEGGRIDHAHHVNNAYNALHDTVELANAVQTAVEQTSAEDTLIIVTADHSHVLTMAGYPKRGNPILGKVTGVGRSSPDLAADSRPFTTLGYTNGPGHRSSGNSLAPVSGGRALTVKTDTSTPDYQQEVLIPLGAETHGGEDVPIYARGPGGHLVSGVLEQHVIFHIMEHAADLTGRTKTSSGQSKPEIPKK